MSSEAVEYVRGVPVVKTFGQTIFSFKKFKEAIDEYEKWTLDYTKSMMKPMVCFTTFANGIFAALICRKYYYRSIYFESLFLYFNYIYFNNDFNESSLCR